MYSRSLNEVDKGHDVAVMQKSFKTQQRKATKVKPAKSHKKNLYHLEKSLQKVQN
jgi:S-adenosylhomocysteine hydrolase